MTFGTVTGNGHAYKAYLNHYCVDEAFKYGDFTKL
jgi:hypothetical protein